MGSHKTQKLTLRTIYDFLQFSPFLFFVLVVVQHCSQKPFICRGRVCVGSRLAGDEVVILRYARFLGLALAVLLLAGLVLAAPTKEDVVKPLVDLWGLVKLGLTIAGLIAASLAGGAFLFSGANVVARENAKTQLSWIVVGLLVINAAPMLTGYLLGETIPV